MGFMNYEVQFQTAVALFQVGNFKESLINLQNLYVYKNQLTIEQNFDLLNYITNCQINLNEVEQAFEYIVVLQSLAEKINSTEALYYVEMKKGIVAFRLDNKVLFEEAFERVFNYVEEMEETEYLYDATGSYLFFLIEEKRFEEAQFIFEKHISSFEEVLQHSPTSICKLFSHVVKAYFYGDELDSLLNLASFIEIHKDYLILQKSYYIYSEISIYIALLQEDIDQLLESTDSLEAYYVSKGQHYDIKEMYKELINVCEERQMLDEAIMFAQKLVFYYKSQGVSKELIDATVDIKRAALIDNLTKLSIHFS